MYIEPYLRAGALLVDPECPDECSAWLEALLEQRVNGLAIMSEKVNNAIGGRGCAAGRD